MSDLIKLGALWESKSGKSWSGKMGNYARMVVTKNKQKKSDKSPDYWVFLAPPNEDRPVDTNAPQEAPAPEFDSQESIPF
jgi:hypothetical protein